MRMRSTWLLATLTIFTITTWTKTESKNTCTYSFTVDSGQVHCDGHEGIKSLEDKKRIKDNQVGYEDYGRGHHHHKGRHRRDKMMLSDEGLGKDTVLTKLLLTVNKLLEHQSVLETVKMTHNGMNTLKDEMHNTHKQHDEFVSRLAKLESQLQILTSGVSLTMDDDDPGKSEIFREFQGTTSRFQDCPEKSKRRIHEMAPIRKRFNEIIRVVPRSCSEWARAGFTQKGIYLIDPDGMEDEPPFKVECQMNGDDGVAVIHHDQETRFRVQGHDPPGSYNVAVKYTGVSMEQIVALITNSHHCEQFLKWECKGASISRETWWVDRYGDPMEYWAGGKGRGCACVQNETCVGGNLCNCDANKDSVWLSDEGNIYQRDHLPVTRLQFGDTGSPREAGFYTLGPLYCFSNKTNPYGTSNAFMPVEINKPFNVFCNFEGWIIAARRHVGSDFSFDRTWDEYKNGFGDLEGEFWLGLQKIHHLTTQGKSFTLQLAFTNAEGIHYYAQYSHFHVTSESDGFRLYIGHFTGTSIDALAPSYGQLFSAKDKDNDQWTNGSCARHATKPPSGGWWYTDCGKVFLFGKKIMWGSIDDMTSVEIMIRPSKS